MLLSWLWVTSNSCQCQVKQKMKFVTPLRGGSGWLPVLWRKASIAKTHSLIFLWSKRKLWVDTRWRHSWKHTRRSIRTPRGRQSNQRSHSLQWVFFFFFCHAFIMTFGHPENFQPGTPMSSQSVAPQMFLSLWTLFYHMWRPMMLYHGWNFHCRCGHLNFCNAIMHTTNYINYSFKLTQSKRTRLKKKKVYFYAYFWIFFRY